MNAVWIQTLAGGFVGLGVSLGLIRYLAPFGWMDAPDDDRKHHARPTPRTGGLALWVVLVGVQLSGGFAGYLHTLDWVAIHLMALMGLIDDRYSLRARYKALAGLAVAMMLAFHSTQAIGPAVEVSFLGIDLFTHPVVVFPLLMLWYWAVPQAYNLIDGINGLSMGFAALVLGVLGWKLGTQSPILWGGLAAVLLLNFPKAHHFLGDCGAMKLGTLFAILAVSAFAPREPNLLLWVFAYPTVDVSLVVAIRHWKGQPLSQADRSHLHHWVMEEVGGRAWLATPLLLGLAALPMTRATVFPGHVLVSTLGILALVSLALKVFKDRVKEAAAIEAPAQIKRVVPFIVPNSLKEASGSHSKYH